ncbi:MAG: hypothetical protein LAO08_10995 [Acidobacteriia bacterium]|nr:hypothetical protein [Terriglobia bacterium]
MKKLINIVNRIVPSQGLYCVWIRAHDGDDAPLIRVWIDPHMTLFESRVKIHEEDLAALRGEALAAHFED